MGTPLHHRTNFESRREVEQLEPNQLNAYQLGRLNELLDAILPTNQFYREKLSDLEHPLKSLDDLGKFPFTTKDEHRQHDPQNGRRSEIRQVVDHP